MRKMTVKISENLGSFSKVFIAVVTSITVFAAEILFTVNSALK